MRKYLLLSVLFCWTVTMLHAQNARILGKVKDYHEQITLTQISDQSKLENAVDLKADGSFAIEVPVKAPTLAYLVFEDCRPAIQLFLEPGIKADLQISFREAIDDEGNKTTVADVDYTGDDKDCFEFLRQMDFFAAYKEWPWSRLSETPFSVYRTEIEKVYETLFGNLYQAKSEPFRRMMGMQMESMRYSEICRWAWAEHKQKDADFERWMLSFDHNDTRNMDRIGNYWRWFSAGNMPPRGEQTARSFYDCLQKAFTNQEIINMFADDMIQQTLKDAPEDMDELLAAYKACSTNPEGHAKADQLYAHYSKMKKGAQAADFDFYDQSGKRYTLKDLRGRAVYIDCWATWCGPCCAEIPFMEKLYEHFKKNKKIELISISLDDNKKKWEKKIAADKPGWRQFIVNDNFKSMLCANYDIEGIPRFMMFDKKGNIISLDAPRPSNPNIIEWIESNLK